MEKYRPEFHYSADAYIINDPNGLVYYDGEYHLFHQYNIMEEIHWGHAVSRDLVHWEKLPNALYPDRIGQIWSGSAVVDEENNRMAAFFTYSEHVTNRQSQGLAFSYDKGRTWEKYKGNPILTDEKPDFRDPKVFRYQEKWVMVLSGGDCVLIYDSKDLIHWNYLSFFCGNVESHTGVWECPDLFPMQEETGGAEKWVLTVSINDGSPAGGTGMQYFVGTFDGKEFRSAKENPCGKWVDYGKDFYAGVTWNDAPDGRRLMIAWADNWQYRDFLPTSPFKGQMSSVREWKLFFEDGEYRIHQMPVKEMECLRGKKTELNKIKIESGEVWSLMEGTKGLEIDLRCQKGKMGAERFGLLAAYGKEAYLRIEVDTQQWTCCVDRRYTGVNAHETFPGCFRGKILSGDAQFHMKLLLDVSQSELFINEGELVMTNLIFPESDSCCIKFYASGGDVEIETCRVYELKA